MLRGKVNACKSEVSYSQDSIKIQLSNAYTYVGLKSVFTMKR